MATFSKTDLSFVKGPPEEIEIECTKCLQVMLDDPHLVSCCGRHFCGPCIKRVKHSNQPCPYCKEKEFQVMPDKNRLRIINGLQVNCTNKECEWKGELNSLPSHINREKRKGKCQFEVVECQHEMCEVKLQRQHLKIHEEEECDQRPYDCQYCNLEGIYQIITRLHYHQCKQYPVSCPNECSSDGKFPRGDIEGHLSTLCPLQPVECEFKWAGCHYRPLRKEIPQHNIESQLNHMSLLAKSCGQLKRENEELKRDNEELKRDNSDMKQQLAHHAMVDDHHPLLPVTVSRNDKGVRYFYSKPCGHLMSVEACFSIFGTSTFFIIKVYKQKSQLPQVSEIVIKYGYDDITVTKDNCEKYNDNFDEKSDIIQEFKIKRPCVEFNIVSIN